MNMHSLQLQQSMLCRAVFVHNIRHRLQQACVCVYVINMIIVSPYLLRYWLVCMFVCVYVRANVSGVYSIKKALTASAASRSAVCSSSNRCCAELSSPTNSDIAFSCWRSNSECRLSSARSAAESTTAPPPPPPPLKNAQRVSNHTAAISVCMCLRVEDKKRKKGQKHMLYGCSFNSFKADCAQLNVFMSDPSHELNPAEYVKVNEQGCRFGADSSLFLFKFMFLSDIWLFRM